MKLLLFCLLAFSFKEERIKRFIATPLEKIELHEVKLA